MISASRPRSTRAIRTPDRIGVRIELIGWPYGEVGECGAALLPAVRAVTDADPFWVAADGTAHITAEAGSCQDAHHGRPSPVPLFVVENFRIRAVAAIGMFRLPPTIGELI